MSKPPQRPDANNDGDDDYYSSLLSTPTSSQFPSRSPSVVQPPTTGRRSRTASSSRQWPVDKWMFTAWDPEWTRGPMPLATLPNGVAYICGQPETCPSTGRAHFQGFVIFEEGMGVATSDTALRLLGIKSGQAQKSGTQTCKRAIDYTKKERTAITDKDGNSQWSELGKVPPNQRKVGEQMDTLLEMADKGAKFEDILRANTTATIRYSTGIQKMLLAVQKPRNPDVKVEVFILWGYTGLGKSHAIFKQLSSIKNCYSKMHPQTQQHSDWWDGYDGQPDVLFDDFNPVQYALRNLLQYLHEWPIHVPIKGSKVVSAWNRIFITTNVPPNLWYTMEKVDPLHSGNYEALWRRIPKKNICRYAARLPDGRDWDKWEDIKQFQDDVCDKLGLDIMGAPDDEIKVREEMSKYLKKVDRSALERTALEVMIARWREEQQQ